MIRRGRVGSAIVIGHARRQPGRGGVAGRLIEAEAGPALRRIEGGLQRRCEHRLFVVGMAARPALAENFGADRKPVRLLHAPPIIGGSGPPAIRERDHQTIPGAFDHRVGAVRDRELRLQSRGNAQAKRRCLASIGSAASAAKASAGGNCSQSRSSAVR
jgi:hypothetical protein